MSNHPDDDLKALQENIEKVLLGKTEVVRLALVGLLARGHVLIEDVPGVGKTALARALAGSISCRFKRIQCTPDLLPSDVTGMNIFDREKNEFEFKHGPLFANVVLADEINRTTPRTQSALLEAMNDFQITVDGVTYPLSEPFMVIATQNPLDYTGTYPLPEPQLDRFLLRLNVGYPSSEYEMKILEMRRNGDPLNHIEPVVDVDQVKALISRSREVHVERSVAEYMLNIVDATRHRTDLRAGVSPRGSLSLYWASQAMAFINNRTYVTPDDVQAVVHPVLQHRLIPRSGRSGQADESSRAILEQILMDVSVPV